MSFYMTMKFSWIICHCYKCFVLLSPEAETGLDEKRETKTAIQSPNESQITATFKSSMIVDLVPGKTSKRVKRQQIKSLSGRWFSYVIVQSSLFLINWVISSVLLINELPESDDETSFNGQFENLL